MVYANCFGRKGPYPIVVYRGSLSGEEGRLPQFRRLFVYVDGVGEPLNVVCHPTKKGPNCFSSRVTRQLRYDTKGVLAKTECFGLTMRVLVPKFLNMAPAFGIEREAERKPKRSWNDPHKPLVRFLLFGNLLLHS